MRSCRESPRRGASTACLVVQFDDLNDILDRHGRSAQAEVLARCEDRLRGALRMGDIVAHMQGDNFVVALAPVRRLDLRPWCGSRRPACKRRSHRRSRWVRRRFDVTASVGFCISGRAPEPTGRAIIDAAGADRR